MMIFFDLDGTLTDISERHYRVYVQTIRRLGGSPLKKTDYWKMKRSQAKWQNILQQSKLDPEQETNFLAKFVELIEEPSMLGLDRLFTHSIKVLRNLSSEHGLALVSLRRNSQNLNRQLEKLGIDKYFTHILSGHSATKAGTLSKKAELISELGFSVSGWIIGDTEADIAAAKQLDIPCVAVTSGIRSRQTLELLRPDHIINSIEEVLPIINK